VKRFQSDRLAIAERSKENTKHAQTDRDSKAIANRFRSLFKRLQSDCKAIAYRLQIYRKAIVISKLWQSDFNAIAERLQSDSRVIAKRLQSDRKAIAKRLQSDCRASAK
jgi:hypothetical protein